MSIQSVYTFLGNSISTEGELFYRNKVPAVKTGNKCLALCQWGHWADPVMQKTN
jgi:hypothetical protein